MSGGVAVGTGVDVDAGFGVVVGGTAVGLAGVEVQEVKIRKNKTDRAWMVFIDHLSGDVFRGLYGK